MDAFSKNKYLFWAVILLIIMNIALLSVIRFGGAYHKGMPPAPLQRPPEIKPGRFHAPDFLSHELRMEGEQAKKLETLSQAHKEKMERIIDKVGDKRRELIEMAFSGVADSTAALALAAEIGSLHKELENLNIGHFRQLKSLCTPEQEHKLKTLLLDMIKMIGSPARKPPAPGSPGLREPF